MSNKLPNPDVHERFAEHLRIRILGGDPADPVFTRTIETIAAAVSRARASSTAPNAFYVGGVFVFGAS